MFTRRKKNSENILHMLNLHNSFNSLCLSGVERGHIFCHRNLVYASLLEYCRTIDISASTTNNNNTMTKKMRGEKRQTKYFSFVLCTMCAHKPPFSELSIVYFHHLRWLNVHLATSIPGIWLMEFNENVRVAQTD